MSRRVIPLLIFFIDSPQLSEADARFSSYIVPCVWRHILRPLLIPPEKEATSVTFVQP